MKISKKASKKKIQKKTQNKKVQRPQSKPNIESKFAQHIELEFLAGLKDIVKDELNLNFKNIRIGSETDTSLSFSYSGNISRLKNLRTVIAVYVVKHFAVPRPKALLGHEHWNNLLVFLKEIKQYDSFQSFRLGAAGQDSPVFQRLKEDLAQALRLKHDDEGDFLLRFRPTPIAEKRQKALKEGGWQVLVRISRRPLSARAWRQCNLAGGLNATVAASIVSIANIQPHNRVYCPMCGSGTLAIETALTQKLEHPILTSDISENALNCAEENIKILKSKSEIQLYQEDVTQTAIESSSIDLVLVNMPWGDAISSVEANAELYPTFFQEMQRILSPNGRILLLTHDIRRFESFIKANDLWTYTQKLQVYHGGHNPKLYVVSM